jgi:hypothetical protein
MQWGVGSAGEYVRKALPLYGVTTKSKARGAVRREKERDGLGNTPTDRARKEGNHRYCWRGWSLTQAGDLRPSQNAIEGLEGFYYAKPPRWWLRACHRAYSFGVSSKATRTPSRAQREKKVRDVDISRIARRGR